MIPLLQSIKVQAVVEPQLKKDGLAHCWDTDSLTQVATLLATRRVSCVPVFPAGKDKVLLTRENLVALVDYSDVVSVVLSACNKDSGLLADPVRFWTHFDALKIGDVLKSAPPGSFSPLESISSDMSLMEACERFTELTTTTSSSSSASSSRLKRLVAMHSKSETALANDKSGTQALAVLAPSALFRYAVSNLRGTNFLSDPVLGLNVVAAGIGTKPVVTIGKTRPILEAFHKMRQAGITMLAVVDAEGKLVGSVSVSDIKLLFAKKDLATLNSNVWNYLITIRSEAVDEFFPYFAVREDARVFGVVQKIIATNVHHVYVIDAQSRPTQVIGFMDLCRACCGGVV